MTLTKREVSTLIRLLTVLRAEMTMSIDSHSPASVRGDAEMIRAWDSTRCQAEEMVKKLDAARRRQ